MSIAWSHVIWHKAEGTVAVRVLHGHAAARGVRDEESVGANEDQARRRLDACMHGCTLDA